MSKLWSELVRWLAREHMAYLEYENRELRYELDHWRHRCEGALDAVRIFEARSNAMFQNLCDIEAVKTPAPVILKDQP